MCYDIKTSLETQLKRAKYRGDNAAVTSLENQLAPFRDFEFHHVSGYQHPKLLIYTNDSPEVPVFSYWGLIPSWIKDKDQLKKHWNFTINARGETISEKPSFKASAISKHCVLYVDGFYEHHHFNSKTYPFHIKHKSGEPIAIAGLWSEWLNKDTGELINSFTLITTKGNTLLAQIHNNPKLKEPRMPVLLNPDQVDFWLNSNHNTIEDLMEPYEAEKLEAYTVNRLRGKDYMGNVPAIFEEKEYPELEFELNN